MPPCHLPKPPPLCTRHKGRTLTKGSGLLRSGSSMARARAGVASLVRRALVLAQPFW